MKVYPKKLHSVKDLQKEKRRLLREAKRLDGEPFFGTGDSGKSSIGGSMDWMALLPANPIVKMVLKMVERKFFHKQPTPAPAPAPAAQYAHTFQKKKVSAKGIAIEVLGGYLKWKAMELTFKAAKNIIKKRKEKKAQEAAAAAQNPFRDIDD